MNLYTAILESFGNLEDGNIEREKMSMSSEKNNGMFYENQDGLLLKVLVNSTCNGCGACSALCDCFVDGKDGKALPVGDGCFSTEFLSMIQEAKDTCPENAISYVRGSIIKEKGVVSCEDITAFIEKYILNYKYPRPKYEDYKWKDYRPDVDGEGFISWSQYEYSSFEKARDAGVKELDRIIFEHIDTYIGQALIEYKHDVLTPLIVYEEKENNYYYREKKRVEALITNILDELEAVTSKVVENRTEWTSIEMIPEFGYNGKNFESLTQIEKYTGMVKGDLHNARYYTEWIDEDSIEEFAGSGFLGDKYVTKWAFNARDAVREIANDLNSGARDGIRKHFKSAIEGCFQFNEIVKPIEEEIRSIGKAMIKKVDELRH